MLTVKTFAKAIPAFYVTILSFFSAKAQPAVPEFGQTTEAERSMKECSFDKSADAVILLDHAVASFNEQYNLVTEHRIRLKILKEKGIERGDIHIPYYSADGFEDIAAIDAVVISPDGAGGTTVNTLERKAIFKRQMNSLYSVMSFALPNVKVGSIIDYQYRSTMKNYNGLRRWEFQKEIPVVTSWYELTPIPNSEFAYTVHKSHNRPIDIKPDNTAGKIRFIMNNIPGLRDEVFMASSESFLQHVNFQFASYTNYMGKTNYTNTWEQLARELMEEKSFGSQVNKDLSGTAFLKTLSPSASPLEKLKTIHDFVRSDIAWNDITSKYSEDGVKSVLEKKKGNSGDMNLLLISLLKSAGIEVYPLLVSERAHGLVDTTYPYLDQFNKVAALAVCNGTEYVLDATDAYTPFFMVPAKMINTTAFLVDKKKHRFVYFNNLPKKQRELISIIGVVHENGGLEGSAFVTNLEYAKLEKQMRFKTDKARYQEALIKPYSFLKVDSFEIKGFKNDSAALEQQVSYHYDLKKSGGYYLLNANLFTGLNENPFITQYRFTDIDFGTKYNGTVMSTFTLPASFAIETMPASKKIVSPDRSMSISRIAEKKDDQLSLRYSIEINRELYAADEYDVVQGFFKEMIDLINEPVLLKSK